MKSARSVLCAQIQLYGFPASLDRQRRFSLKNSCRALNRPLPGCHQDERGARHGRSRVVGCHGRMAMKGFSDRSACVYAAAVAALILLHAPGLAAETAERPYNPPVGSRWIIESEANSDQARTDRTETLRIKTRAELTIDAKTSRRKRTCSISWRPTTSRPRKSLGWRLWTNWPPAFSTNWANAFADSRGRCGHQAATGRA